MEPTIRIAEAIQRLKGVFLEMPGTQLSLSQAAHVSGIEPSTCEYVLTALEEVRFLVRGTDGRYRQRVHE